VKRLYIKLSLVVAPILFIVSCGDISTEPENPIGDAWNLFMEGSYEASRYEFASLTGTEGARAYVGLGWSYLRLGNIVAADTNFNMVSNISGSENSRLANSGWTFVKWGLEEYSVSIIKANFVLVEDSSFTFRYDISVSAEDLILIQAYSYFHLAEYVDCINRIRLLDSSFSANPTDQNIVEILLVKLEALKNIYD